MHKTNGKEFIQTWSFDLKKKSEIGIWFASEAEEVYLINYISIFKLLFSLIDLNFDFYLKYFKNLN
jgi:hypothetical protein